MTTVHMIGNAHLDPVWLWRKPEGIVETVSTCRTAADLLDRYPDLIFTRSDMWLYEQIALLDPKLFERIKRFVADGRWYIPGGWYIQPDCNLPSAASFRTHMSLGKRYFKTTFGVDVTVGYNVDTFGHTATLPSFLAEAGYTSYVMMRPNQSEKPLPSPLFRWRSPDGAEVVVWRIVPRYATRTDDLREHVEQTLAATEGFDHVMCFFGVGDHGGGPTVGQVEWIQEHADDFPGARLEFSHPGRFFDAVLPDADSLPIVADELQYHAIGCYSVTREIKVHNRKAEDALATCQAVLETYPQGDSFVHGQRIEARIENAWKNVLFNQFHDILAGTSIPDAYEDSRDELGQAKSEADSITTTVLLRELVKLGPENEQRLVVFNPTDAPFDGCIVHEPWLESRTTPEALLDEKKHEVEFQLVQAESVRTNCRNMAWTTHIPPRSSRTFYIRPVEEDSGGPQERPEEQPENSASDDATVRNGVWCLSAGAGTELAKIVHAETGSSLVGGEGIYIPVWRDETDTWSHGVPKFSGEELGRFAITGFVVEETGPVRSSVRVTARFRNSEAELWFRIYPGRSVIDIDLRLSWREHLALSTLCLGFDPSFEWRTDGIPGGEFPRRQNGWEYPVMDWTILPVATPDVNPRPDGGDGSNQGLGIVCPDCTSLHGEGGRIGFTLVRSPAYAWHDPATLRDDRAYQWTDQGEHTFRFKLIPNADPGTLNETAVTIRRKPLCFDWTHGM